MSDVIAGYRCLGAMSTTGSGSARWCFASRGMERYFLKEFLSPVYPADAESALGQKQLERCLKFETRKQRLYSAASCVIGDTLMPVIDFFRENGRYYAVTEVVPAGYMPASQAAHLNDEMKQRLLYQAALCLQRLHMQGIVHADLKPEHLLYCIKGDEVSVKLIDLDSGFLVWDLPMQEKEIEGDPAYLAPEAFLKMVGAEADMGCAVDTFAFGALIHAVWTGRLPAFDEERYHYLYEAALDGGEIILELPEEIEPVVRRMLAADADVRPSDAEITALFTPKDAATPKTYVPNGLKKLMKA